jgi:photosystem II stability/assembly factor-like uncharacterized protein
MGYHPGNGSLWVGTNTGSAFTFSRWATVTPASGWSFAAGDFSNDGKADVIGYHPGNGSLWVGTNNASGFNFTRWTTVSPASGWSFIAGDFTGDGRTDVAGYHPGNGSLWVAADTGSASGFTKWTTLMPAAGWAILAGEFAGNGQADIVGYQPANGTLWTGTSTGAAVPPAVGPVSPFQPNVRAGGRAVAVAVEPNDANRILVASETGGLFRTSNRGRTWTHVDSLPNHRILDVEFSPDVPNLVVAAAESNFRVPNDGGIWRSTDGGLSWTRPTGAVPPPSPRCAERSSAYEVSFQPGAAVVFVGTDCGVAISRDNGATWAHTQRDPSAPVNPTRTQNAAYSVLVTRNQVVMVAGADGLWRSSTGGLSWARITAGPQRGQTRINHAFAVSPGNLDHLFHAGGSQQLFQSTDAGISWTQVPAPSNFGRGVFVRATRARSGNPNEIEVYFGDGMNLQRQMFTSTASGLTGSGSWTRLDVDHSDPADVGFDRAGAPVLVATDGGVHSSPDGGNTWRLTGGGIGGFNALQIYEITGQTVVGPEPHQDLYYATQDNNVAASFDGGLTWLAQPCCEGNYLRVIPGAAGHVNVFVTGVIGSPFFNFISDPTSE